MKFTILCFKLSLCEVKTTNFDINFDFLKGKAPHAPEHVKNYLRSEIIIFR